MELQVWLNKATRKVSLRHYQGSTFINNGNKALGMVKFIFAFSSCESLWLCAQDILFLPAYFMKMCKFEETHLLNNLKIYQQYLEHILFHFLYCSIHFHVQKKCPKFFFIVPKWEKFMEKTKAQAKWCQFQFLKGKKVVLEALFFLLIWKNGTIAIVPFFRMTRKKSASRITFFPFKN